MRYLTEQEIRSDFVAGGEQADGEGGYVPSVTDLPGVTTTAAGATPVSGETIGADLGALVGGTLGLVGGVGGSLAGAAGGAYLGAYVANNANNPGSYIYVVNQNIGQGTRTSLHGIENP